TEKINTGSQTQWRATHNGSGNYNDFGNAVGMDGSGNVIVTGGTNIGGFNNMCTIKFAPGTIGISPVSNEIPNGYSLSQNYPNPFNPVTTIEFSVPVSGIVKLVIYNSLGKEVESLVNNQLNPGKYKADWDASKYSSGVYFFKILAGSFTETKRMILVK
ncbi:MAG TPA: T9SS type A sorting domain-containing protein, partial [Ignavibacteria bacterium]|nr:T9SS type A sorting domain-containing protein [Ignavibacteria bacterium]